VNGQSQPTVGYVLSTSDKWFVVLTERDRTIDYIKADDVTKRRVCAVDSRHVSSGRPLVVLTGASNKSSSLCPNVP